MTRRLWRLPSRLKAKGEAQVLRFTTNVDETAEAGPEHPIRVEIDPVTQEPAPYVHVRTNLEALIHRNVFYQLVELAVSREIDGQRWLGVWSGGEFFRIGLEPITCGASLLASVYQSL